MLRQRIVVAFSTTVLMMLCQISAAQEVDRKVAKERQEADAQAEETLAEFFETVEGAQALYEKAAGYAIFRVTKAGFGVSGAGGTGVAVNQNSGSRVYMKMGAAGVGFTFGASRYDIVILFETEEGLSGFTTGGWDSAATAQAAAGSDSTGASTTFFNGVAYFQLTNKGLMASADVSGTRFWVADDLN